MADKTALAESSQALFCAIADLLGEIKSNKVIRFTVTYPKLCRV